MKANYVEMMKMMGNVHCLAVFLHLSHGRYSLDELVEKTGFPSTNISYHIKRLRDKDLIEGYRCGHQMYYRLIRDREVRRFVADIAEVFTDPQDVAA